MVQAVDNETLSKISEAAFSNPFAEGYVDLYRDAAEEDASENDLQAALAVKIEQKLLKSLVDPKAWLKEPESRRQKWRVAILFCLFYRYADGFESLMRLQEGDPDSPGSHPVTERLYQDLLFYGLSATEAASYVSMAFQFRRGFELISSLLVGASPVMQEFRMKIWRTIFTDSLELYEKHMWNRLEDFSVLLLGQTGTGKGLAARAIGGSAFIPYHPSRKQFTRNYLDMTVGLNLSEFQENLIESELFGHRKGAFSGAVSDYPGHLSRCRTNGVLFLDEVGELSHSLQVKLLRVLQERRYHPVGSRDEMRFHGRFVTATNRNLMEMRANGEFRDDFYYRIASDVIEVPSLKARLDQNSNELKELSRVLLKRILRVNQSDLEGDIIDRLHRQVSGDYNWPGNVRELEQALRSLLIGGRFVEQSSRQEEGSSWVKKAERGQLSANELLSAYCCELYRRHGTYEAVADRTALDRRTAKKYIEMYK